MASASRDAAREPIAICGMAMRMPGGISSDEGLWDTLVSGKDMRSPIPPERWNPLAFGEALGKKGAIKTQHAYFLHDDLAVLDASFFSLTKSELERTDPQQRKMLEVTRECLESAGETNWRGKQIGCFVGTFGEDWLHQQSADKTQFTGAFSGSGDLMIANRVSYEFDFRGPSEVIKTGCSASLVGLHNAVRSIQSGDCESAIVAGTSLIMGPYLTAAMTHQGVLSPEGSCKTFDASADGFARADAINAVFIKPLSAAERDGNPIRAVIRGTSTNSDGHSASLMAPSGEAHEALMRKVYDDAGLDPKKTGYVECHGTGTATGDPIETTAVGNVFGEADGGIFIGSIKPNVGHAEGASGINSLIKAVLCLERKTIPPQIKFDTPNPKIPFQEKNLHIALEPTSWPENRAERVSVNSFGIGGTNAHVIIDSYKQVNVNASNKPPIGKSKPQLVVLSANTQESLNKHSKNAVDYLTQHPEKATDVAYTLARRREPLQQRTYVVTDDKTAEPAPIVKAPFATAPITMVFSGQGAQWPEMGRLLLETDAEFEKDIGSMDAVLKSLDHPPTWTLDEELSKPAQTSQINKAEFAQPLCTAIQIGIVNVLTRLGISPAAVVGHSSGEIAAAYAAGALSMSEAIICAYYRGYISTQQQLKGGMAAIGMGVEEVQPFLKPGVVVACENSPSSTTISGDIEPLRQVISGILQEKPDVLARELKVDMAYHSHHMRSLSERYIKLITAEIASQALKRSDTRVPLFSSVHNRVISAGSELDPEYWAANLTSPVRFGPAVATLIEQQGNDHLFLEIGPHSTLAGPLRQICKQANVNCTYVATQRRGGNSYKELLNGVGQLFQNGVQIDFEALIPHGNVVHDFPAYPWDHSAQFWQESRVHKEWRMRQYGHHAILGQRIPESTTMSPQWRVILDLEDEPWLADHKVRDDIVFPFAGYVCMVGEAIRQLTAVESGYSVRHVVAHTALVLKENTNVELVTSLNKHKLTDSNESIAYEFTISSYAGGSWIKHAEGLVKPMYHPPIAAEGEMKQNLPRQMPASKWYEIMARVGLVYGPEFQGITELTASPTELKAQGVITTSSARQEAPFFFHPAGIDACLQMVLAAVSQAAGRHFTQLAVPTLIEELDISRSALQMNATAWSSPDGKLVGLDCFADGHVAMRLRGARMTPLEDERTVVPTDKHAAARLEWYPDFDFLDVPELFDAPEASTEVKLALEELALLCLLDSHDRVQGLETKEEHYIKFRQWLAREKARAESGDYPVVKNAQDYVKLSPEERQQQIQEKFKALSTSESIGLVATGIMRICEHAEGLFTGKTDTLDLLMKDNVLTEIYNAVSFGFGAFVRMLAITKPNLRILEVGAGTGGTTELILRELERCGGNPSYSLYTFTDISAGFFAQAKERFAYAPNIDYKVFDISQDPFEQGFESQSYDLILAPNVVHATPNLNETLRNLQPLLKPHGHLVLSEVCAVARAPGYVFGNFSGWWLGEADDRKWEPYIMPERWDRELKAAGFTGADTVVYDAEAPYQYCAAIVASPKFDVKPKLLDKKITVLCDQPTEGIAKQLISELEASGSEVSIASLGDILPEDRDVIATLDLESRFFENISEKRFVATQELLRNHKQQNLLWLMPPTQTHCVDPRSAQTVGMWRVARAELALPIFSLEIDPAEANFTDLVSKVFQKVRSREDNEKIAPDREYAVDQGIVKIGRYQPFSLKEEVGERSMSEHAHVKSLTIGKPGMLDTLRWVESPLQDEVAANQVEVNTRAVGLNFRDVMVSMGVLKFGKSPPLGLEITGVVKRVGSGVSHVKAGDRVCGVATDGCFSTHAILLDSLVVKIPEALDFVAGATMPACYTTAVQAVLDVGQLQKGQTILIHSAAGGVGHAAIQLAKMVGAEIYATVGSDEKIQYLQDKFQIPKDRIFNSRNDSFLADVMRETNGKGVDIVLNSLSGELLHASWKCVAEFGRLVELGKRDLVGFGKLDLEPFLLNRSYCCVDLAHAMEVRPASVGAMMERWVKMLEEGKIQRIDSVSSYEGSEIVEAFRHMQNGDHIGKVVVTLPEDPSTIPSTPQAKDFVLSAEQSYLLTGGLGGLGRSVASWMVEQGARHLIFLSRSAGSTDSDQQYFRELEAMGCTVTAVQGKADNKADVVKAIRGASKPIKGVFHMAMVLRDAPVLDLSYEEWTATVKPKVDGAWNIHEAFEEASIKLDFLVMTSSLVTLMDQPGQANYAAANTFLESFTQYRHRAGLAASVLGVCPIDDIGFVAENPLIRKKLKSQGLWFLPERELLDYIELAILNSHAPVESAPKNNQVASWKSPGHMVMGLRSHVHLEDPNCQTSWRRDRRMGMYHNVPTEASDGSAGSSNNQLKAFISRAADDVSLLAEQSSHDFLAEEIGRRIFRFMMKPEEDLKIEMSLTQIGLDSLMAIELRRWWKQNFGLDISVLEIMASGTLSELGKVAASDLATRFEGAA